MTRWPTAWWLCRVEESVAARQRAYTGHVAAGADRAACGSAWFLFYEHHLAGRVAIAAGWLARSRHHLDGGPECVQHAYLALAEVFWPRRAGTAPPHCAPPGR
ncbi:hypothetical protein [Pseudonocardia sp. H11422]|uniref:hypothetical protein n=1 Tax=Pseudonocardia sp. H11422 TaxID=2835866 RepID=UPI001BDD9B90|nr:hypothetical protein [Pseudonocardia sp. H11422]